MPVRGARMDRMTRLAKPLERWVTAFNVTDNQRGLLRASSIACSAYLARSGFEPICQITCRDKNRLALQSDLIGLNSLGISNVLLLSGDHPRFGDHPDARAVYDLDTIQLIQVAKILNEGNTLAGKTLKYPPTLFIGAVANPMSEPLELQVLMLEKKKKAGARFIQTQGVYDVKAFQRFLEAVKDIDLPILAGILPLPSAKAGRYMNKYVPGMAVPNSLIEALEKTTNPETYILKFIREIMREVWEIANGIHFMPLTLEENADKFLDGVIPPL